MKRKKAKSRKPRQKIVKPAALQETPKKRRGRPPKISLPSEIAPPLKRKRGRPRKVVTPLPAPVEKVDKLAKFRKAVKRLSPKAKTVKETPLSSEEQGLEKHPVYLGARWLSEHTAPTEDAWIKKAQRQMGLSRELVIAKAVLDMFNVSQEADIRKAIKHIHKTNTHHGLQDQN